MKVVLERKYLVLAFDSSILTHFLNGNLLSYQYLYSVLWVFRVLSSPQNADISLYIFY